jgi:hypothetical protein
VGIAALMAIRAIDPDQIPVEVPRSSCGDACGEEQTPGCTVFTLSKGEQVYFGGNDDYINPDSYYWVDQGGAGKYGAIWVGTPDNVQQGVNEMGLAYDANGLPRVDTNPHPERLPVSGSYTSYPIQILQENATVAEVIRWVRTHQWHSYMHDQMQFADASGDAVIISAGQDGELVFTRKPPGDGFLVSTNFNIADPSNGTADTRYPTAQRVLGELLDRPGRLAPADAATVLEAVHVEGGTSWTIVSLLADLPNAKVHLYYFHQFDRPLVLDVAEQLANPPAPGPLSQLFPQDVQREAARRYQHIQAQADSCHRLGNLALGVVAASLVAYLVLVRGNVTERIFWGAAVLFLGPLGLLVWAVAQRRGMGRRVLTEAVGDVVPTTIAFLILLAVIATVPEAQSDGPEQTALMLALPLLFGLLLFHGPLLASSTMLGYFHTVRRRLPHVVIAAYLGLAGVIAVGGPLINLSLSKCAVMPLPISLLGVLWGIGIIVALFGGLLLYIYQAWAVRRGFRAWSLLAAGEVGFSTPTWRQLWWWIPLTLAALVGSVVVSQYLQGLLSS